MFNRRKFLQQSSSLALAGLVLPQLGQAAAVFNPAPKKPPLGLQLFTLGNLMIEDTRGTLQKVAAIGYTEIETADYQKGNYYGFTPKQLSAMMKELGLRWRSAHVIGAPFSIDQILKMAKTAEDSARIQHFAEQMKNKPKMTNLKENYQQLADEAAEGGISFLVCSSMPVGTLDEIKTAVDVFSKAGEACMKNGVQFAYHNHATEFETVDGVRPFDYILNNTDKNLVKMELDLAWATVAKQDPVELFNMHRGRFPAWHVKDIDKLTQQPTEVGAGIVDFKRIFEHAKESGMEYVFVEQDAAPQPLQNVTNSYNYLKKMLG
ncbi:MAG: sugar phosphate isomerase/epimerase [Bacteroidetes bacterium]|nr:sugar phosphate isomerase/epimerase [Bacteroidota bacterium]